MSLSSQCVNEKELRVLQAGAELEQLGRHLQSIRSCMFGEPDLEVERALRTVLKRIHRAAMEYADACEDETTT